MKVKHKCAWILTSAAIAAISNPPLALCQGTATAPSQPPQNAAVGNSVPPLPPASWVVRDPTTGRLYQQQLANVTVPVTRMQATTVDQLSYELQTQTRVEQVPQTVFKGTTQYVLQPKLRGWWNPMREPVQSYESVPITTWEPQTQMALRPTVVQQWVAKPQKVVVYQPVQTVETRTQVIQTPLPSTPGTQPFTSTGTQPSGLAASIPFSPSATSMPTSGQPLIRLPLLARQRMLPWSSLNPAAPPPAAGLRPIPVPSMTASTPGVSPGSPTTPYPLAAGTYPTGSPPTSAENGHRDTLQAGMSPTVLY
jgi:hypothetical protein